MKFLIDAQLPRRMAKWLHEFGFDAIHTLDLPEANCTTDTQVIEQADREERAVVTKDADFVDAHLIHRRPKKLLLISTGNISNADLEALLKPFLAAIAEELESGDFIELDRGGFTTWRS